MLPALGILRLTLLGFALLNTLPPLLMQFGVITVPAGEERLRFCLHSFNTENEIDLVLDELILSLKAQ